MDDFIQVTTRLYCDMNNTECGCGVWTKIANVNMTFPSNVCSSDLEKVFHAKVVPQKQEFCMFHYHLQNLQSTLQQACLWENNLLSDTPDAFYPYYDVSVENKVVEKHQNAVIPDYAHADGIL